MAGWLLILSLAQAGVLTQSELDDGRPKGLSNGSWIEAYQVADGTTWRAGDTLVLGATSGRAAS